MAEMEILGAKISDYDMVETVCSAAALIDVGRAAAQDGTEPASHQIVTLNAEILYKAQTDPRLLQVINQAELVTPDGSGIVLAAQKLCGRQIERVTGIDLMQELCRQSAACGWRVYLLGAKPGVAEAAAQNLQSKYGTLVCGWHDGYFSEDEQAWIIGEINEKKPDILFVGLGAPRQEFWIAENRSRLRVPLLIGVGGCFDVISGNLKRAPLFFQRLGLEWLWRLLKEPWRFGRMLALPKFVLLVNREQRAKQRLAAANQALQESGKKEKKLPQ
ncbi:MAG: WecB/TagA/CpsF family glycosyltransferase [Clostridium sp.]|nr:WecB/TagA/CpsF family glycosyltransferase [Clostridium sp.]